MTLLDIGHWLPVSSSDPRAYALYRRHYSRDRHRGTRHIRATGFAGVGEHLALMTVTCDALFVWRLERFRHDGQEGINCAVFRNEGPLLSSLLIREACELAWTRWPGARLWTYVNPRKIRSSNPGFCFKKDGWRECGRSKGGLVILERLAESDALAGAA